MPFSGSELIPRPTETTTSAPIRSTSFLALFLMSRISTWISSAVRAGVTFSTTTLAAPASSNGWVCITPGRTVDICGRKRGQMMVAIRWPPNAGRVIFRLVFSSNLVLSTSMVEVVRRKSLYLATSTSKWVQSAVRPVCRRAAQRGPRSRPRLVAPISIISGFFSMMRSHRTLA